jgi:RNA polymerase sigma-70 factor (ECF subfamily)
MVAQVAHVRELVQGPVARRRQQRERAAQRALFVEALFRRHSRSLLWYVTRLVRSRADAEEVVQEAFLRLLGAERLEPDAFRARQYLFATATNLVRDNHRRRTARAQSAHVTLDGLQIVADEPDAATELDVELGKRIVDSAMRDAQPRAREAFRLYFQEGLTYGRIALKLGVSKKTIERDVAPLVDLCRSRLSHSAGVSAQDPIFTEARTRTGCCRGLAQARDSIGSRPWPSTTSPC